MTQVKQNTQIEPTKGQVLEVFFDAPSELKTTEEQVKDSEYRIKNLEAALKLREKELEEWKGRKKLAIKRVGKFKESVGSLGEGRWQGVQNILNKLPVKDVEVVKIRNTYSGFKDENVVIFNTEELKRGRRTIGTFKIAVDSEYNVFAFNMSFSYGSLDHPAISGGSPCWGNTGSKFLKTTEARDIFGLVEMMLEFITESGDSNAYKSWSGWFGEREGRPEGYYPPKLSYATDQEVEKIMFSNFFTTT